MGESWCVVDVPRRRGMHARAEPFRTDLLQHSSVGSESQKGAGRRGARGWPSSRSLGWRPAPGGPLDVRNPRARVLSCRADMEPAHARWLPCCLLHGCIAHRASRARIQKCARRRAGPHQDWILLRVLSLVLSLSSRFTRWGAVSRVLGHTAMTGAQRSETQRPCRCDSAVDSWSRGGPVRAGGGSRFT